MEATKIVSRCSFVERSGAIHQRLEKRCRKFDMANIIIVVDIIIIIVLNVVVAAVVIASR